MGIFDKIKEKQEQLQGAVNGRLEDKIAPFLTQGEQIEFSSSAKEDFVCMTDKKLIFVDGSLLSSKNTITMLPYGKISSVSLEKGGMMNFSKNVVVSYGSRAAEIDTYSKDKAMELVARLLDKIQ